MTKSLFDWPNFSYAPRQLVDCFPALISPAKRTDVNATYNMKERIRVETNLQNNHSADIMITTTTNLDNFLNLSI